MTSEERRYYLLSELSTVPRRIEWHKIEDAMSEVQACAVALVETLQGMCGLDDYPEHESCFDPDVTQAIGNLIDLLHPRIHPIEQRDLSPTPQKKTQCIAIHQVFQPTAC